MGKSRACHALASTRTPGRRISTLMSSGCDTPSTHAVSNPCVALAAPEHQHLAPHKVRSPERAVRTHVLPCGDSAAQTPKRPNAQTPRRAAVRWSGRRAPAGSTTRRCAPRTASQATDRGARLRPEHATGTGSRRHPAGAVGRGSRRSVVAAWLWRSRPDRKQPARGAPRSRQHGVRSASWSSVHVDSAADGSSVLRAPRMFMMARPICRAISA